MSQDDLRQWPSLMVASNWILHLDNHSSNHQPTIKMELVNSSSKIGSLQNHKVRRLIKKHLINHFLKILMVLRILMPMVFNHFIKYHPFWRKFWWFLVFWYQKLFFKFQPLNLIVKPPLEIWWFCEVWYQWFLVFNHFDFLWFFINNFDKNIEFSIPMVFNHCSQPLVWYQWF